MTRGITFQHIYMTPSGQQVISSTIRDCIAAPSQGTPAGDDYPQVKLHTNIGDIVLELDRAKAPKTVENFLRYVNEGFYTGTVFHRVIPGFMIQGGGMTADLQSKPTHSSIQNEADNGLKNENGTVAMARTSDPNSATSQFFINVADNAFLDHKSPTMQGWGYAVFGKVTEGMDVVMKISTEPTHPRRSMNDVPTKDIVIERAEITRLFYQPNGSDSLPPAISGINWDKIAGKAIAGAIIGGIIALVAGLRRRKTK